MTKKTATHSTFVIERHLDAKPERVWRAWSDPAAKSLWFGGPSEIWTKLEWTMDFRVGGHDRASGDFKNGPQSRFDSTYFDIIPNERIVYAYEMHLDDKKISVSLATIELTAEGGGTRLVVTEQGAFLDGYDDAGSREQGTKQLMDRLEASLRTP